MQTSSKTGNAFINDIDEELTGDRKTTTHGSAVGHSFQKQQGSTQELCALIRYRTNKPSIVPYIRVFTDLEFRKEMQNHPARDKWWE